MQMFMLNIKLNMEETDSLYGLPYHVALLIASADGYIDETEIKRAISVIGVQANIASNKDLLQYFESVKEDAEDKLRCILSGVPKSPRERTLHLSKKIVDANLVLRKLSRPFVQQLHKSLCDLARQIAKASGGVFGYGSIGVEESQLIDLSLLDVPN
jgi:hypothetical protein